MLSSMIVGRGTLSKPSARRCIAPPSGFPGLRLGIGWSSPFGARRPLLSLSGALPIVSGLPAPPLSLFVSGALKGAPFFMHKVWLVARCDPSSGEDAMSSRTSHVGVRRQRGWAWLPAAIGAAASIGGNLMGRNSAKAAAAMQDHYINNAIGIRVADARRQGIHPVAALGFSGQIGHALPAFQGDWGAAGQDIGRAVVAGMGQGDRDAYAAKELSQFAARARSNQLESQDLDLELKRLQLTRLQNEVGAATAGYDVTPNQVTASNPDIPSVAAGPAGPGFKATSIGYGQEDIGSSEMSEWAEGAGLVGHGLVPFWMYKQALARGLQERADAQEHAIRTGDPAYHAALRELRELGEDYYLHRIAGGWEIRKKYAPAARRGEGRIGTDVWKPRGGRFHRGVVE